MSFGQTAISSFSFFSRSLSISLQLSSVSFCRSFSTCFISSSVISEDFSFFSKARPGVYAFVGAGDDARRAPLHSDRFDFDERALLPAVDWYTRIIETFAKED